MGERLGPSLPHSYNMKQPQFSDCCSLAMPMLEAPTPPWVRSPRGGHAGRTLPPHHAWPDCSSLRPTISTVPSGLTHVREGPLPAQMPESPLRLGRRPGRMAPELLIMMIPPLPSQSTRGVLGTDTAVVPMPLPYDRAAVEALLAMLTILL